MARGDINEYYDPRHERQMAEMLKRSQAMNQGTHLGGLASLLTQLHRGFRMQKDRKQRADTTEAVANAMSKSYKAPVEGSVEELVSNIDNASIMADPDEYPKLAEKLKNLSGTGAVSTESEMIDKDALKQQMGVKDIFPQLAEQIDPNQLGGRTQLDNAFVGRDTVAAQEGYDPYRRALSNLRALGGDNPYAARMAANMGMQQAGAARTLRADAEKRKLDFADKIKFLQEKNRLGVSDKGLPNNIVEWNIFKNMSKEDQDQYLLMKRSNPYLDAGGSMVQPLPSQPGKVGGEIKKTAPVSQTAEFKAAVAAAVGKRKGIIKRMGLRVTEGQAAAKIMPTLKRSLVLLDTIKTGGIDSVRLRAKKLFGIEGADEGELSQNLGKAILSQLRATFGAAFTEKEGDKLADIEAGFSKSPEANRRMLENLLKLTEKYYAQGITAAEDLGDLKTAASIRELGSIVYGGESGPALAAQDAQAVEWLKKNPNHPRAADIRKRLGL